MDTPCPYIVDKACCANINIILKVLVELFQKLARFKGEKPLGPAFLFGSFFFAPPFCKEKSAKGFVQLNGDAPE